MCQKVHKGFLYKDCVLYVGEYVVSDDTADEIIVDNTKDELGKKKNDIGGEITKEQWEETKVYRLNKKKEENKKEKRGKNDNKEKNEKRDEEKDDIVVHKNEDNNECNIYSDNKRNNYRDDHKNEDEKGRRIILEGPGKYIKQNEIFVGNFEKNEYRKGIWVKYRNIHNLFFYMNIYDMMLKENRVHEKHQKKKIDMDNFKNLLYVPLKEVNIYIGEFDNNMFNGFSFYYFYPFLYIGYFVNNLMNGYGYMFYIASVKEEKDRMEKKKEKKENIFATYSLFDFLFVNGTKNEKGITRVVDTKWSEELVKKEGGLTVDIDVDVDTTVDNAVVNAVDVVGEGKNGKQKLQNGKNKNSAHKTLKPKEKDNIKDKLLFRTYEKIEKMIKEKNELRKKIREEMNGKSSSINLIDKIEKNIFKNFKLQIKKDNKIKRIKKFLNENEKVNIFDIFKYISYDNLFFKGYFYNNHFSSNTNEQEIYKTIFLELYKDSIIKKIEVIKRNVINGVSDDDLLISNQNALYILEKRKRSIEGDEYATKEDGKSVFADNAQGEGKIGTQSGGKLNAKENAKDVNEGTKEGIQNENFKQEYFKDIIDFNLLKNIFESTSHSNINYSVEVVTDKEFLKYKIKCNELIKKMDEGRENCLDKVNLNLNGYYQLVVLNFKCKDETSFNLNINKCNIQNIHKIKMFFISSDKSSIIKYNAFHLHYIFVYIRSAEKKGKNKLKKIKK
ncbi:hypothetical protein MKS88_002948 [Plasmodium brasilianum]|uniref:Uncharacterized protein n=2 Tax=Plasmodium (Plasmodium) TaxID=418103 RepID=A0A1A8WPH6_PLAMA|nr:conserved Plasmodium protein, unknown function [Plasmodium malariae]KAI4838468.1 hypothetical protein MKS88_002948 [Plasmodium brasilianum]SBS94791.1 conserved Plasmodium protein, unknown function [Plasmodium malariae]SCN12866.1 conserved Plasmodium protein, unknown function [Plasmodium malariae]